ncbi:Smad nuclear interacting protein 1 [Grifola frondosa]|uniref:Smad nuclear interacting protein 1 n=1 Tax=Grifola frondosa TaxID=5627 RepID=A0A1C7M2Z1_GRIFR|nr:Smad nuclear interacting protein 1 [Grifola frondosa]
MARYSRGPSGDTNPTQDRFDRDYPRRREYEREDRKRDEGTRRPGYESRDREEPSHSRDIDNHDRDRRDRDRQPERGRDRDDDRRRDRDDDRPRDRDRDRERESRAGPSRRSVSPRPRSTKPSSRSQSGEASAEDKTKPNFAPSGLLAAATKTVKHGDGTSTVLKYHEPPEARKPVVGWRLYVFKGKEQVDLLHIQRQSAYLIGRDRAVVDVAIDHPSCSKQHAVIQYRQVPEKNEFGDVKNAIKPFIIDLESTNGTFVNDEAIPTSRYFELKPGDGMFVLQHLFSHQHRSHSSPVIKFGESAREYVLLHDEST